MSIESDAAGQSKAGTSLWAWLWKLLFIFLLGPILLFPSWFSEQAVLAALGLLLLAALVRILRTRQLLPPTPITFLLLPLLLIFLPFSLWLSPLFVETSWPKAASLIWSAALFYTVVDAVPAALSDRERRQRLKILTLIYIAAGILMTAVGILAMERPAAALPLPAAVASLIPGESINPNEVGGIITLYLPLIIAFWAAAWAIPEQRSLRRFILYSLPALFAGAVLLITASFGALLGVIAGCALVLLLLNHRARLLLLPLGLAALIGLVVVRLSPLFDQLELAARLRWTDSIAGRLDIWQQALHTSQDFPLGTGLGSFRYVAPVLYPLGAPKEDVFHAHNLFWQTALDFGWLGGLLFLLIWLILIIYLVRYLLKNGQTNSETSLRIIAIGLLGSLLAHALYSLFDALALGARPGFALWYLFGLIVAVGAAITSPRQIRRWRIAAVVTVLIGFALLLTLFWPLQQASSVTARALLSKPQINETAAALSARMTAENCRLNWHLGRLAHQRDDLNARNDAWQQLLACSPQHTPMMQSLAPQDHDLAAAAVALQPADAAGHFWLAALAAEDDLTAAIPHYEAGLALSPADGLQWVRLGRARETVGDLEGAVAAYDQGCLLVDAGKNGCGHAGRLHMAAGSYELAAESYRTSLRQLPGWGPGQRGLADALLAMGRGAEAVPYLTNLAENGDDRAQEQLQELTRGEQ